MYLSRNNFAVEDRGAATAGDDGSGFSVATDEVDAWMHALQRLLDEMIELREFPDAMVQALRLMKSARIASATREQRDLFMLPRLLGKMASYVARADSSSPLRKAVVEHVVDTAVCLMDGQLPIETAMRRLACRVDESVADHENASACKRATEEGHAREADALDVVHKVLERHLRAARHCSPAVAALLRRAWKRYLVVCFLRFGPESTAWHAAMSQVNALLAWPGGATPAPQRVDTRSLAGVSEGFCEGLTQIGYRPFDLRRLWSRFAAALGCLPAEVTVPDAVRSNPSGAPFDATEAVQSGRQFEFLLPSGCWQTLELSWTSHASHTCHFIDVFGCRVVDIDEPSLRRALRSGRTREPRVHAIEDQLGKIAALAEEQCAKNKSATQTRRVRVSA